MKAVILNASPRKNWNTAQLLKAAQKGAEEAYAYGGYGYLEAYLDRQIGYGQINAYAKEQIINTITGGRYGY